MAVKKFRSIDEMNREAALEPGDPRIWDELVRRWHFHNLLAPPRSRPRTGVFKYRSIEAKQAAEEDGSGES